LSDFGAFYVVSSDGKKFPQFPKGFPRIHEIKRIKALPTTVRDFYYEKGLLYLGLKAINEAGRELHADSKAEAAKYDLSILYRNTSKKKPAREASSAPTSAGSKG
jgi:hypothetical protein